MITGKELVAFAKSKLGVPYVYGMKGEVMTLAKYNALKAQYGSYVWKSDKEKVGKVCCDCSGLISWATGKIYGSGQLYQNAKIKRSISTINLAPIGALVWKQGHVGIYIGDGKYIAEDGSAYGCRMNYLSKAAFTHWLIMDYIDYTEHETKEVDDEVIKTITVIVNGVSKQVRSINKDGHEFVMLRDLASDKIEVGYNGQPIVNTK